MFLFDWGSVAGSTEFHAFLYNTGELQNVDLKELQPYEALAFWVNIYNVLLLHLYIMKVCVLRPSVFLYAAFRAIINRLVSGCFLQRPPGDMSVFGRKTFFTTYKYNIGGNAYSLKDIEEGVIRGYIHKFFKAKDPRFRYAIKTDPRAFFLLSWLTKTSPIVIFFSFFLIPCCLLTKKKFLDP